MGWAVGRGTHPRSGRPRMIGYGIDARCDQPGCNVRINRGLSFRCGGERSDGPVEGSCGGFYCGKHLLWPGKGGPFLCESCITEFANNDANNEGDD